MRSFECFLYLCNVMKSKNNTENTDFQKVEKIPMIQKLAEDKAAICKCVREGGNLEELARKRNIVFSHPFAL